MENILFVCPGSINPDFVISSDEPLKLVNRTTTFSGASSVYAGGKGRNQAIAAKRAALQSEVFLVSCVGEDALGTEAIETLKKAHVNTKFIFKSKTKETGKCILSLFKGGYQIVGLDLAANTDLTNEDINKAEEVIAKAKVLLCQIENTVETTLHSLKLAKKHEVFTILNPSLVPDNPKLVVEMFPFTDLLVLNLQEAEQILGKKCEGRNEAQQAAKELGRKVLNVVLTLGEEGAIIATNEKDGFISAFKVEEVDTTACGDVFAGTLAASILEKLPISYKDLEQSVKFAAVAAALAVTKIGASESAPTRQEIDTALSLKKK